MTQQCARCGRVGASRVALYGMTGNDSLLNLLAYAYHAECAPYHRCYSGQLVATDHMLLPTGRLEGTASPLT